MIQLLSQLVSWAGSPGMKSSVKPASDQLVSSCVKFSLSQKIALKKDDLTVKNTDHCWNNTRVIPLEHWYERK